MVAVQRRNARRGTGRRGVGRRSRTGARGGGSHAPACCVSRTAGRERRAPSPAPVASAPRGDAEAVLRLPVSLDLPAARPLAAALLERRGQPITIDASAVGQIGAQCVQVLLSAKRTWEADGVSLSIVNCAARMIEDLKLIGIDRTLVTGELPQ